VHVESAGKVDAEKILSGGKTKREATGEIFRKCVPVRRLGTDRGNHVGGKKRVTVNAPKGTFLNDYQKAG